ncbi:hypothetical protein BDF19DRAFT_432437 [Syncephalis fuscata]|nr:hypothetical protein BDF19DRAFT_432437 [Syncephalis fuscata]
MTSSIAQLEWKLLVSKPLSPPSKDNADWPANSNEALVNTFANGCYADILQGTTAKALFGTDLTLEANDTSLSSILSIGDNDINLSEWISQRVKQITTAHPEQAFQVLVVGAACLNAFYQSGWTGPVLSLEPELLLPEPLRVKVQAQLPRLVQQLSVDSEDVYHLALRPLYIILARAILVDGLTSEPDLPISPPSSYWWAARCLFTQQQLLDNGAGSLYDAIINHMSCMEKALLNSEEEMEEELRPRYWLERGLMLQWYGEDKLAVEMFTKAQEATGLRWQLTGALGKRTKFQIDDKSQLVIVAASATNEQEAAATTTTSDTVKGMPNTLALNDDTLLETIALTKQSTTATTDNNNNSTVTDVLDPHHQSNLRVIDQCLLLAFCLNVKNTNPDHGLTTNEMNAYVQRVLQHPNNWMVHTMGLLLRSRLESNKLRTVERSALQLQALIDQIPLDESSASERLAYIYDILLPSKWMMEKELAERYMSIGVVRSALEIFERLEMWEDVIQCYISLEDDNKALKVIERELERDPKSPKMWCLMGDIKKDYSYYEKAWELSGQRYARAMRSLAGYYFRTEEWRKSLECYMKALAINPLFENTWFIAGCAALRIEDWEMAETAFRRVVSLNDENAEAWNNQASVLIRLGRSTEAYHALKQAIRNSQDNWRVWTNFMHICMEVGECQQAIQAMQQVVEIRADKVGAESVDIKALEHLLTMVTRVVDAPIETVGDAAEAENSAKCRLRQRFEYLLRNVITARITNNSRIWQTVSRFYFWANDYEQCLDAQIKAYRALLHSSSCESSAEEFEAVADMAIETADLYRNLGPQSITKTTEDGQQVEQLVAKDWQFQARSLLRSLVGRTRDTYAGTPVHDRLVEALADLKQ